MRPAADRHTTVITLSLGILFAGVFAGLVIFYGRELRADIRIRMIERDAAVLQPVVQQQIEATASLDALLPDARREGMLALALFDEAGITLEKLPATQLLVELPLDDLVQLQDGRPISRFNSVFPLSDLRIDATPGQTSPVLEIVLPLHRNLTEGPERTVLGFVRYHLDARPLAAELAALDENVRQKTLFVLALGVGLIALIVIAGHLALARAQRTLAERNTRLARTHAELSLASKASVLGQIASHLIHDLRGPVSGLQAVMHSGDTAAVTAYVDRLQSLIQEASDLLSDQAAHANYQLSGAELAEIIRRRNEALAAKRGVKLSFREGMDRPLDSHRGGLLSLILNNLVHNALLASAEGGTVQVDLASTGNALVASVIDEGGGIPADLRPHLFTPGRSGRAGGTGLGLAISRLLARQMNATLELVSTGPHGSEFRVTMPLDSV